MDKKAINERFLKAVDYLLSNKIVNKKAILANTLGITVTKFSEILNSRMNIGTDLVATICVEYNICADWLLTGRGNMICGEFVEQQPEIKQMQSGESAVYYKMYKEKDEENKTLLKEIGCLEERIRQLEAGNLREKTDAKDVSIKKHSSSKTDDAGSAIVR